MENVLKFEHPEMLYWLILIPALIIIYILVRLWQDGHATNEGRN